MIPSFGVKQRFITSDNKIFSDPGEADRHERAIIDRWIEGYLTKYPHYRSSQFGNPNNYWVISAPGKEGKALGIVRGSIDKAIERAYKTNGFYVNKSFVGVISNLPFYNESV